MEWAAESAALRYARILNEFSFLISRRSPISARTRAIARLSTEPKNQAGQAALHAEPFWLEMDVAEALTIRANRRAASGERDANGRPRIDVQTAPIIGQARFERPLPG